jgi:hypothetical protein
MIKLRFGGALYIMQNFCVTKPNKQKKNSTTGYQNYKVLAKAQ